MEKNEKLWQKKKNYVSEMDPKNDEKLWQTSTESTETWGKEKDGKSFKSEPDFSASFGYQREPLGLVARRVFTVIIISTTLPKVAFSIPAS